MEKLRFGIMGAGGIGGFFARSASGFQRSTSVAIGSRQPDKARAFAEKHGLDRAHGSYAELINDPGIDAVYNALPDGLHKEWTQTALERGKHVLCEKPMALTRRDAEEMFEAADRRGLKLVEGFPFRFQQQTIDVLACVERGEIGELVTATACFGFRMRDPSNVRLDPDQGAGSLWDVGVYPINLLRAVFGKAPAWVSASGRLNEDGVDLSATALLGYDDGRQASLWSSFETEMFRRANIVGVSGAIEYIHKNNSADADESCYWIERGPDNRTRMESTPANGFVLEADAFADLVAGRPFAGGTTPQETVDNIATAEAIIRSMASGMREPVLLS